MLDIQQFLINKKIEFRKEGKNVGRNEVNLCCPFCGEDRYHCGINQNKNLFHCWKCGEKGDIAKLISKLLGISYIEAKQIINPISDLKKALEDRDKKIMKVEEINKPKSFKLPNYTKPFIKDSTNIWQEIAHDFLVDKYNLTWEDILDAKLHYCFGGKYKNRIIIPCYFNNKMVSFIARTWDKNGTIRYMNCPNEESLINIKKILYNYDNIKIGQKLVIVTEGVFDCIKVGLGRSVAVLGTEITKDQLTLLAKLSAKNLIVMFDSDPHLKTTNKKAQDIVDYLSPFSKTRMVKLPHGKDPGEMERNEIDKLIGGL